MNKKEIGGAGPGICMASQKSACEGGMGPAKPKPQSSRGLHSFILGMHMGSTCIQAGRERERGKKKRKKERNFVP